MESDDTGGEGGFVDDMVVAVLLFGREAEGATVVRAVPFQDKSKVTSI